LPRPRIESLLQLAPVSLDGSLLGLQIALLFGEDVGRAVVSGRKPEAALVPPPGRQRRSVAVATGAQHLRYPRTLGGDGRQTPAALHRGHAPSTPCPAKDHYVKRE